MYRRYFHVTTADRVPGIIDNGLDPSFALGKIKAVWLVDSKRLLWAMTHVSVKRDVSINALWVVVCHVDPRELQTWRWRGVYLCRLTVPIYDIYEAAPISARGPIRLSGERG